MNEECFSRTVSNYFKLNINKNFILWKIKWCSDQASKGQFLWLSECIKNILKHKIQYKT